MPAINQLKDELFDITTLHFISQAFTEASAAKIKKIRMAFEQNKEFYSEISHVYHIVRRSTEKAKEKSAKEKKSQVQIPEPKVLSVALTSNQRFYGNINATIMKAFFTETADRKGDLLIIGKTGKDLAAVLAKNKKFENIFFTKESPNLEEVKHFLDYTKSYNNVYIYYPKFVSLVTQTAGIIDITQAESEVAVSDEDIKILYEPELEQILEFFTRQVRVLLFLRVNLEAELSRTAARLLSMSAAEERSEKLANEKKRELRKIYASIINRQLLETFVGMRQWKTH